MFNVSRVLCVEHCWILLTIYQSGKHKAFIINIIRIILIIIISGRCWSLLKSKMETIGRLYVFKENPVCCRNW